MPCIKCSNGKWRIGSGRCVYTTLKKCKQAEAAIHIGDKVYKEIKEEMKLKGTETGRFKNENNNNNNS